MIISNACGYILHTYGSSVMLRRRKGHQGKKYRIIVSRKVRFIYEFCRVLSSTSTRYSHIISQRTFSKLSLLPRSIGPFLPPSSSMSLIPDLAADNSTCFPDSLGSTPEINASLFASLGAATKHVKCRSVSRSLGGDVWPSAAISACILVKSGVVSRSCARSSGVLSGDTSGVRWGIEKLLCMCYLYIAR